MYTPKSIWELRSGPFESMSEMGHKENNKRSNDQACHDAIESIRDR